MKFTGEKLIGGTLALTVLLGACGGDNSDNEISKAERDKMIRNISAEHTIAQFALAQGQLEYNVMIESLPDDCEEAIKSFVPPEGVNKNIPTEDAIELTAEWCGPDNLDAVRVIRREFIELESLQDAFNHLSTSLAANLAAAGVQPTPTSIDD